MTGAEFLLVSAAFIRQHRSLSANHAINVAIHHQHLHPVLRSRRFQRFEGTVATYLHGTRIGVVVEHTGDMTAAKDTAMHIAAMKPVSLVSADVPAELIARERSVAAAKAAEDAAEATAAGKPTQSAEIVTKRIEGSVQKYLKEVALMNQAFVKNDKQTVEQMLKAAATTVKGFTLYVVGEGIEKKVDDFAAEVAAQIAASKAV